MICAQVIVMPDFRRPPDASSADALDDVRAAYERVLELGAARACVGGDSAGGGLALAFAIKIRDAGATPDGRDGAWRLAPPAGCLAISPWVDLGEERTGGSRLSNERWDFLPGDMIDLLARETVEASGSDASHSPVKFDLHGLPPTLIQTGQCEVLHDQQVRLCAEIKISRRDCPESSRRSPRHRRDACSMAWQCRFLTARRSQHGRVIVEK